MRRGIGRARLCDIAPCPERWPCRIHGTRRVGDYEHLGRHAGAFELAPITHGAEVVSETVPCSGCGWALCSCPPDASAECCDCGAREGLLAVAHGTAWGCADLDACKERLEQQQDALRELPDGWTREDENNYLHHGGAFVSWRELFQKWLWWPAVPESELIDGRMATSRDDAMAAALAEVTPHGPALRPGWTTDGESYFNDSIGLMVGRAASGKWRILGNSAPWPQGYAHGFLCSSEFSAMRFAEIHASNRAREREVSR